MPTAVISNYTSVIHPSVHPWVVGPAELRACLSVPDNEQAGRQAALLTACTLAPKPKCSPQMAIRSNRELLEGRRRRRLGSLGTGGGGKGASLGRPRTRRLCTISARVCLSWDQPVAATCRIHRGARGAGGSRLVHRSVVAQ